MSTAILIPVMRPHKALATVETLEEPTATVYFIGTQLAVEPLLAAAAGHVIWDSGGTWAERINLGVRSTGEDFLFLGAEDLRFHSGWLRAALLEITNTGAGVIGVNDLHNPKPTAFLVARTYIEHWGTIDGPGVVHEGYQHNWVDNELIETAVSRRCYSYAKDAIVEHLHPDAGKAEDDEVYALGRKSWDEDMALYGRRRHLWAHPASRSSSSAAIESPISATSSPGLSGPGTNGSHS